ncbi:MAG TPA: glycoside hydrolase family 15 protein [Pyrinomonadaceae bacterium]|jgi:glucoamylase
MNPAKKIALVCSLLAAHCAGAAAQSRAPLAPGAPGGDAHWTDAGKDAVGTSNTTRSKVWFTLGGGVLEEVYYPTVDVANVQRLELIIAHAQTGTIQTEEKDTVSRIVPHAGSLSFTQVNTAKNGEYRIEKDYTVDPQRNVLLVRIRFRGHFKRRENDYRLFVYYDPSLNNSGMHDTGFTRGEALLAQDGDKASALLASYDGARPGGGGGFVRTTSGFMGVSDGLTQMSRGGGKSFPPEFVSYERAEDGNVVQLGELPQPAIEAEYCCGEYTLALGFGKTTGEALEAARASLRKGFAACEAEYVRGWRDYLKGVRRVAPEHQRQYDMAAMVLRAHEDKTYRGAMIASLSVPWGGGPNANEPNVGGYHLVWSRDLYHVATAFLALGDKPAADRALNYLFTVQQKSDGSFPQNSWLDGRPFWGSLQLDEVAYPLVLAYQLGRTDAETWAKHVRPAADFLARTGPRTPQERWEEKPGYSPSTLAAEIAGLVCAAEIAGRNGDQAARARYLAAADEWARNVERWTATTTGKYGDGNYYLRVTDNDDPNDGAALNVGNGGGDYDEREIVDAGFLELVRLGIRRADDPLVAKSLAVVDSLIKIKTPNGETWYRYNHDGYGEMDDGRPWNWDGKYTGKGHPWPLLAGERGEYELARGEKAAAARRLASLAAFANEGMMIPEQVWDARRGPGPRLRFGEGTGSATPLAWSMAQFVRLATNLQAGRNLETPDIVSARYAARRVRRRRDLSRPFGAPSRRTFRARYES